MMFRSPCARYVRIERRRIPEDNSKASICDIPELCASQDGLNFMYPKIALLSDGKFAVIIPATNREEEARNLRPS